MMPVWIQNILIAAGLIAAVSTIAAGLVAFWKKVLKPGAKLVTTVDEMLPLLKELTAEFKNTPHAFAVLDDIVAQFRTDSGSSLRDVVNALQTDATAIRAGVERAEIATQSTERVLAVALETVRQLAQQDRDKIDRLIILLDRLTIKVDAGSATSARIEKSGIEVAMDLSAAHKRADDTHDDASPGTAADAAAQQTTKEKIRNEN